MKNFDLLVKTIRDTNTALQLCAVEKTDKHITLRNWLIGFYIVEFEKYGEDHEKHSRKLMQMLADSLVNEEFSSKKLRLCRLFYVHYPQIAAIIADQLEDLRINIHPISQSPIAKLLCVENEVLLIEDPLIIEAKKVSLHFQSDAEMLVNALSFPHFVQLFPIISPEKRAFYERECINNNWSVSELKRQIGARHFERSGMVLNPQN